MKTKKNNTKKEQITAQVENQEIVANATEVTNPTIAKDEKLPVKKSKKDKKNKKAKVEAIPAAKD